MFGERNTSHFHTGWSAAISPDNCIIAALLHRVEVHGRGGGRPNKDMSPGKVWEWWNEKEKKEEEGDKWVRVVKEEIKWMKRSVKERSVEIWSGLLEKVK